jgi:hypothetical protein
MRREERREGIWVERREMSGGEWCGAVRWRGEERGEDRR